MPSCPATSYVLAIGAGLMSATPAAAQSAVQVPLFDGALVLRGEVGVTAEMLSSDSADLSFWRPIQYGPLDKPIGGRMDCRLAAAVQPFSDAAFNVQAIYEAREPARSRAGQKDEDTDILEQPNIRRLEVTGRANNPHRHYVLTYLALRDGARLYDIRMNCDFLHLQDPGKDTDYAAIMHQYVDLAVPVALGVAAHKDPMES